MGKTACNPPKGEEASLALSPKGDPEKKPPGRACAVWLVVINN
jgi:hypothetical protein